MTSSSSVRSRRPLTALLVVAVLAALAVLGFQSGAVSRTFQPVPAPPANPTNSNQIQNIDQVRTAIKAYYKDTTDGTTPFGTVNHVPSADGAYAAELGRLEKSAAGYLAGAKAERGTSKAILLDVDDTSLNTYNYEIYSNFAYNPTTNAEFVNKAAFPAVFGMPKLAQDAKADGYTVFFLTGRPASQLEGTLTNLDDVGFPVDRANVYLKDQTKPWLSSCAPTCTTIQYKSLTRKYIESQGYDIKGNFGDQLSDLAGGYADKTFKLPNPMYYLP